jgi:hypothetical protein
MSKIKNAFLLTIAITGISMIFSNQIFAASGKGMTWGKSSHDNNLGIDLVGCYGSPLPTGQTSCNAYTGDTSCATKLPVLCIKKDNSPRPNYAVPLPSLGVKEAAYYKGWAGGHLATTLPTVGSSIAPPLLTNGQINTSPYTGDNICKTTFGDGWKMAEHHDGKYVSGMGLNYIYGNTSWNSVSPWPASGLLSGGWSFYAYGNVRNDMRYWVRINDQPANCWDI